MRAAIAVAVVAVVALAACGSGPDRQYERNDLQLLTGYTAKEACSCLFVMKRTEQECARWVKAAPDLKTYKIDYAEKRVEAQAVLFWGARARWVSDRRGCILE